ncbi:MAG: branched-chain amino acid ABC transporter permease [Coriobacteriales bacterium]|nr:branched-chain amino acid ABC transporter permease [Coriobacteriales bacterium]
MNAFKNMSKTTRSNLITYGMVILAFAIMQGLIAAGAVSSSLKGQLVPISAYICLAISLNLVVGISGELSLGHAGFMSVGAFTGVVVSAMLQGMVAVPALRFVLSCLAAGAAAALAGFLVGVPVMRLRGDYLAIVTLAFGEIIKNLLNNTWLGLDSNGLHFSMANANALGLEQGGKILINGPQGAAGIDRLSSFTFGFVLIMLTLFVVLNLIDSRSGRAIMAVRDNRIAAESVGISTTKYRLMAFVVSAGLAGMAGTLYAMNYNSIVPSKFDFNNSINILVFVVLGGMGNIRGGIISATLLTVLPEKLRFLGDLRMLIYAVVLILVMLVSNNQQLRSLMDSVVDKVRRRRDDDDDEIGLASKGGAA